ncbi:MAG TPA: glycerol-3-phosphate acyltransferase [Ktedonobacterales bacterium]|nr:glycerol-3-phosphate acyltransferase [Ktedonobacterales bacterium]
MTVDKSVSSATPRACRGRAAASPRSRAAPVAGRLPNAALDIAVCAGAYLYGSLPLVYVLARRRQVDLKRTGSGNVGATNLMASGGPARALAGWLFDASKGLAPILVSRRLGRSRAVAELAGVCGAAGQCWPLFLRFSGGRGISAYVGAGAAMDRGAWAGALLPMIGGSLWRVAPHLLRLAPLPIRSKSVPLGCFISAVALPLLVGARRGFRPRVLLAPTLLSAVVMVRRLTAPLPDDATDGPAVHRQAWLYRLLYDRNTST